MGSILLSPCMFHVGVWKYCFTSPCLSVFVERNVLECPSEIARNYWECFMNVEK